MLYPEGGKFHVSLSLPGQQSKICKNIGITASVNFLVPTIEYIVQCAVKGELGIADSIKRNKAVQHLNRCKSPETLNQFAKSFGVTIEGDPEKYRVNGKYRIPQSAISLNQTSDPSLNVNMDTGLKMIEKTAIKSILEQYKPFIEVSKLLIQNLSHIEDIIARTSALIAPSAKPRSNSGNNRRPKSLGYRGASEMKRSISKLNSLSKKKPGTFEKINSPTKITGLTFSGTETSNEYRTSSIYDYEVISTVYSTGFFKEGVDYEYRYIDIKGDDNLILDDNIENSQINKTNLPKSIIFGIYDSEGNPINPEDPIRVREKEIKKADWLLRTGRWYGHFPRKGLTFLWRNKINKNIKYSPTNPQTINDGPYEQLFYKDPTNLEINRESAIIDGNKISIDNKLIGSISEGGNPESPVLYFTPDEKKIYNEIFESIVDDKFKSVSDLSNEEKSKYKEKILNNIDIQLQLESVNNFGFLTSLFKNGVTNPPSNIGPDGKISSIGIPKNLKNSFLPKKIRFNNADIWIDPESDYDMKLIKVDSSSKILDKMKTTNSHLAEDNPLVDRYSTGFYGQSEENKKQTIQQIFRYMKSENDVETYYIVEGILNNSDVETIQEDINQNNTNNQNNINNYYGKKDALGAIKSFILLQTDIYSKTIPAINKLISLFKNPSNFIVEIIKEKLGESTEIFSPKFLKDYQEMISLPKDRRREFVRRSSLRNYVYVNPLNGDHTILFDGAAIKKLGPLFGASLNFGIEVKSAIPKLIFKIDLNKMTSNSLESILKGDSKNNNIFSQSNVKSITPSKTTTSSNGIEDYGDEVTVKYSTGKYIEGVQYQYIYVTEYVSRLVSEGDELAESNDPEQMNLAFSKYDEALNSDPNNQFIKDRISNLMNRIPNYTQPIMDLLLTLVTGPLKIVADVVQFIMDFLSNMNIATLPIDIPKFISFSWLIKEGDYSWSKLKGGFFAPSVIFKTFGLDVLPISIPGITPPSWTKGAAIFTTYLSGAIPDMPGLNKNTIPPDMPVKNNPPIISNFNDAMSLSFAPFMKRPTLYNSTKPGGASNMSKDHLLTWFKKNPKINYGKFNLTGTPPILEMVSQFICFIESIINSAIDIFWAILGLEVLIPPPHINICNKLKGNNITPESIMDLLNGKYNDSNLETSEYDFIYEIKTSDGRNIRDLNKEELQKWIDENMDYEFEFLFNN